MAPTTRGQRRRDLGQARAGDAAKVAAARDAAALLKEQTIVEDATPVELQAAADRGPGMLVGRTSPRCRRMPAAVLLAAYLWTRGSCQ